MQKSAGTLFYTIPPIVHTTTGATSVKPAGVSAGKTEKVIWGAWVATNSTPLIVGYTTEGTPVINQKARPTLEMAYTSDGVAHGQPKINTKKPAKIYTFDLDPVAASPIFTKDQMVFKFERNGMILPGAGVQIRDELAVLKSFAPNAKFLLVAPPFRAGNELDKLRLDTSRMITVLGQMREAGIELGQVIVPSKPPVKLESLGER